MLQIANIKTDNISVEQYVGKAFGLKLLSENGLNIPNTFAIQATDRPEFINDELFRKRLFDIVSAFLKNGKYDIAIRSSCTVEDGFYDSMQVIFLHI